jgi:hypothetical protein
MRPCAWCKGPIPEGARRDAVTCSKRCRQARHRVTVAVRDGSAAARGDTSRAAVDDGSARAVRDVSRGPGGARRLAYADPPYPGKAFYYRRHPDYAGEVDHAALLARLSGYDGWALSTSARALPQVLALAVAQGLPVRVASWVRGARPHETARHALNGWEPVIYVPVVSRVDRALQARRIDVLTHGVAPMTTLPGRVIGAKPAAFCRWMFGLIGASPGDTLDDLFPGSGIVGQAWRAYVSHADRDATA